MKIFLTNKQMCFIIKNAKKEYPIEVCGILTGRIGNNKVIVRRIEPIGNISKSPYRFQVDYEILLKLILKAEVIGDELIGFYHSHPTSPRPSIFDVQTMKLWPDTIWVIISTLKYFVEAYQCTGNIVKKIKLVTVTNSSPESF